MDWTSQQRGNKKMEEEKKMPRRHINASERIEKRWSDDYIRQLMRSLAAEKEKQEAEEKKVNIKHGNRH